MTAAPRRASGNGFLLVQFRATSVEMRTTSQAEEALVEAERDRQMVEAVVQKILSEDAAEIAERNERKAECRALIAQREAARNPSRPAPILPVLA